MIAVLAFLLVALPVALITAWVWVLRRRGVPGRWFFLIGATLVPAVLLVGEFALEIENRGRPAGCESGSVVGMVCGHGISRGLSVLDAAVVIGCLVVLAVASAATTWTRRRRDRHGYRGQPALVAIDPAAANDRSRG